MSWAVISRLPASEHENVRRMWRALKVVREDKTLLPLFLFLSRKVPT